MKSKSEIIEAIAGERMVETMVENIAHHSLNADPKDETQIVYQILVEYDETKPQDLWENDQMSFFIARIIINQYRSSNSPFYTIYRKFRERTEDITGKDWIDDDN